MLLKSCTQYVRKFGRPSHGHRTGKAQSPSLFPRRALLDKVQAIRQLYSSPMLVRLGSKSWKLGSSLCEPRTSRFQTEFRKGRGTRDQIANICWIINKAREFQKNIYFCFIDYTKAFDCVDHNNLWKILQEMGIPDHLTCLLRNLYAGQEVTVRTRHGTKDWFQIGKGVCQGCILSPCLFNLYAEYIIGEGNGIPFQYSCLENPMDRGAW